MVIATSWQQVFTRSACKKEKNRKRFLLIQVGFKSTGKKAKSTHVYAKKSSSSTVSVSFVLGLGLGLGFIRHSRRATMLVSLKDGYPTILSDAKYKYANERYSSAQKRMGGETPARLLSDV